MTLIDSGYGTKIVDICLKDKDERKSTHHWISEEVLRRVFNSLAEQRSFYAVWDSHVKAFIDNYYFFVECVASSELSNSI
jgi:hypothetical protein